MYIVFRVDKKKSDDGNYEVANVKALFASESAYNCVSMNVIKETMDELVSELNKDEDKTISFISLYTSEKIYNTDHGKFDVLVRMKNNFPEYILYVDENIPSSTYDLLISENHEEDRSYKIFRLIGELK